MTAAFQTPDTSRSGFAALRRGFAGRCPNCGTGRMFRAFLKVADHCDHCGEALHHQRADDAPAYFVIAIVGHIVVPLALAVELAMSPSYLVQFLFWVPVTLIASLLLLQPIKGAIVGWQWAHRMHGFEMERRPAPAAVQRVMDDLHP